MSFIDLLKEPAMVGCDIDSNNRIMIHQEILRRKALMRAVFIEYHHLCSQLEQQFFNNLKGPVVELGAGVAPVRDTYPNVLATDVVLADHLDCVIDAQQMAFSDNSIKLILGRNCFHHFPDPEKFFTELMRILIIGGGAILYEPYYSLAASFIFKHLFQTEGFDKNFPNWSIPSQGPMNGANQALSYIVFKRDLVLFESMFPALKVIYEKPIDDYLRHLLSGGLNFKQLVPSKLAGFIKGIEKTLSIFSLNRFLALHHVIVLKKIDN